MSGWYQKISKDISTIPEALEYFENQLQEAKLEIKIRGNVEKQAAEMPGNVEHRFNQLQELEAVLEYLNIELRRLRSSYFKKYFENYGDIRRVRLIKNKEGKSRGYAFVEFKDTSGAKLAYDKAVQGQNRLLVRLNEARKGLIYGM